MSKVRDVAAKLRQQASELEAVAVGSAATTPHHVIQRYSPEGSVMNVENTVDLVYLGMEGYSARKHLCAQAGHQLGRAIADKLSYSFGQSGMINLSDSLMANHFGRAIYRATVHVFTPAQLESLVAEAMRIGRQSS